MDSNKDEALRCLDLARQHWKGGDHVKAQRFVEKSVRLFPTPAAEQLGNEIRESRAESSGQGTSGSGTGEDSRESPGENRNASSTAGSSSAQKDSSSAQKDASASSRREYTAEQLAGVKGILKAKDYYVLLGVSKTASETELKKAYRKLALQFHPDKNQAPGADEAFKAIGTAFSVLSNEDKRRRYDQFGPEAARGDGHAGAQHAQHYQDDEISPEELFNLFFGGGFPNGNVGVHRRRNRNQQRHHHHHEDIFGRQGNVFQAQATGADLIRLLPVLLIIVTYVLFSVSTLFYVPPYSMWQSADYPVKRMTTSFGSAQAPYFVSRTFANDYKSQEKLHAVEESVMKDYIDSLRTHCMQEKSQQRHDIEVARWRGSQEDTKEARTRELRYCKKYYEYAKVTSYR